MFIYRSYLENNGFTKAGSLKIIQSRFKYRKEISRNKKKVPGVYLWLQRKRDESYEVVYAGKAGFGIDIRMNQHLGGLKKATAERIDLIKTNFGEGYCLEIWFRESSKVEVKGLYEKEISNYSTEEEALITHFSPLLNRAKTPSMRKKMPKLFLKSLAMS